MSKEEIEEIVVNSANLKRVYSRPPVAQYISSLYERRFFIAQEARTRAYSSGRDTFLGGLWVILNPLFQVIVYVVVFGFILNTGRGIENYVGFLVIGVTFFGFFSQGANSAISLMQRSKALIASFNFPRAAIPLSNTYRLFLDNLPSLVVASVLALVFQPDRPVNVPVLFIFILYLVSYLFILGLQFWIAVATALIPDLKSLVQLTTRAMFFISGVFFSVERFETHPTLKVLVEVNPVYQFLDASRSVILGGHLPELSVFLYLVVVTITLLTSGFLVFWMLEEKYAQL